MLLLDLQRRHFDTTYQQLFVFEVKRPLKPKCVFNKSQEDSEKH